MPEIASAVSKWLLAASVLSGFLGGGLNFRALAAEAAPNFAAPHGFRIVPLATISCRRSAGQGR